MHLPNQSKPAVRDARRRPWRRVNAGGPGMLPQHDEDFEVDEGDESGEVADEGESGE